MPVETPEPAQLLDRLSARLADPAASSPLAVLDPTWPPALLAQARAGARAGRRLGAVVGGRPGALHLRRHLPPSRRAAHRFESWRASLEPLTEITGIGRGRRGLAPGAADLHAVAVRRLPRARGGRPDRPRPRRCPGRRPPRTWCPACWPVPCRRWSRARRARCAPSWWPVPRCRAACALGRRRSAGRSSSTTERPSSRSSGTASRTGRCPTSRVRRPGWRTTACSGSGRRTCVAATSRTTAPGALLRDGDWASVGDRAAADGAGWQVLGRGSAAVTTGGHTVLVEEVEAVLGSAAGACWTSPSSDSPTPSWARCWLPLWCPGRHPAARPGAGASGSCLPPPGPVAGCWPPSVPRTPSGKIRRDEVARQAAATCPLYPDCRCPPPVCSPPTPPTRARRWWSLRAARRSARLVGRWPAWTWWRWPRPC